MSWWGAHTSVVQISALALVYSAMEYAVSAWCRSTHTKKLDVALNDTLRIISGCLKPTRREILPVFSGIPPVHLRKEHSTFKLAFQAQLNTSYPLHTLISIVHSPSAHSAWIHDASSTVMLRRWWTRLQSPGVMDSGKGKCETTGSVFGYPCLCLPPGSELPRSLWVAQNRLRTGVRRLEHACTARAHLIHLNASVALRSRRPIM